MEDGVGARKRRYAAGQHPEAGAAPEDGQRGQERSEIDRLPQLRAAQAQGAGLRARADKAAVADAHGRFRQPCASSSSLEIAYTRQIHEFIF